MMTSRSETILLALFAVLDTLPGTVKRNEGLATAIPQIAGGGLVVLQDGDPGEPEVSLSPLTYYYDHTVDVEIFVQGIDLDLKFDALKVAIGQRLTADRTLGGLVDWVEPMAPKPGNLPEAGMAPIKAATIPVVLSYTSTHPLT